MVTLTLISAIQGSIQETISTIDNIYNNLLYINNLIRYLEIQKEILFLGTESIDRIHEIEIRNLSFCYRDNIPVLKNMNLIIKSDTLTVITGNNGSGKSTLIKLLSGLYLPTEGEILINGRKLTNLKIDEYYNHISVLFSEYGKYMLPIKENVFLGDIEKDISEVNIINSLSAACIYNKVAGFEKGIDTQLGLLFENGVQLSNGEWLKTCLARIFYRNRNIIFLDEPTSELDLISEEEVMKYISSNKKEKIIILTTHRTKPIEYADIVIKL